MQSKVLRQKINKAKIGSLGENSNRQISTKNDQLEKQKDTNTVINVRRGHKNR